MRALIYRIFLMLVFMVSIMITPITAFACDMSDYTPIADRYQAPGLLFKLEHCTHPDSYVFGTMHLDDAKTLQVAKPAFAVISKVESVLLELVIQPQDMLDIARLSMLPSDNVGGLKTMIGAEAFAQLVVYMRQKQPLLSEDTINRMRPWMVAIMLQVPAAEKALDELLQHKAQQEGKLLVGLETTVEQLEHFTKLPKQKQIDMLHDTLQHFTRLQEDIRILMAAYHRADLAEIARIGNASIAAMKDKILRDHMQNVLLDRRNTIMVERALPHMQKASALLAVGALHLPGKGGILERLEQAGYRITQAQYPIN